MDFKITLDKSDGFRDRDNSEGLMKDLFQFTFVTIKCPYNVEDRTVDLTFSVSVLTLRVLQSVIGMSLIKSLF